MGTVDQTSLALKIDAGSLTYQKAPAPLATIVRAGVDAAAVPPELHVVHVVAQEEVSLIADASTDHRGRSTTGRQRLEVLATGRTDHGPGGVRW